MVDLPRGITRTIVWRPIATAPKDGSLIEVSWLHAEGKRLGPKRTRWQEGKWVNLDWPSAPTNWRPIERK